MLREVDCKEWQIVFARTLQEYLYKNGFKNLIEIRYNKEGKLYTIKNKKLYIDTEKVEGRPFEIDGEKSIKEFCKVLSEFHGASEGFVPPPGIKINVRWGKLTERYKRYLKDFERIKDSENKTSFEAALEPYWEEIYKRAKEVMKTFRSIQYLSALEESMKKREVCLNTISKNTAIKTKRGIYLFEIFDSGYNMIEEDIAKLIKRGIQKTGKKEIFDIVLSEYEKYRALNSNSIEYIKAYVSFPYNTLKLVSKYLKGKEIDYEKKLEKALLRDNQCNLLGV
ncbi:Spore coat protein cotS related [Caloramator australicus]|uniref:Spore coat protein cotS related n=1 Tax=Caloramator australicus RC3 TaxID=857293 RepID=I7J4W7_9CLOT|nr:Spore coat protein cotS related [Caloramator australicus]CCJ33156.1 Spore coat protein cotS related [Caloramator australicus RC3]